MTTTEEIRRWATALPEVQETSHGRFHVPVLRVRSLVEEAWREQAPRRLVAERDRQAGAPHDQREQARDALS